MVTDFLDRFHYDALDSFAQECKLDIALTRSGELIGEIGSCKEYIETYSINPEDINMLVTDQGRYKL